MLGEKVFEDLRVPGPSVSLVAPLRWLAGFPAICLFEKIHLIVGQLIVKNVCLK